MMSDSGTRADSFIHRLVLFPALVTLAVTLLRLTGELRHWSARWFSPETGGITPQGVSWVVGITWLAAIFGIYFALKLVAAGHGPRSLGKAAVFAGLGVVTLLGYGPVAARVHSTFNVTFPQILIVIWLFWAVAGALQYFGWPDLFKALLHYGYSARVPVAVVMFFAMLGSWGTHYDYVGMPPQFSMSPVPRYLWLALFPQLVAWVGFTIVSGTVTGILTAGILRLSQSHKRQKLNRLDVG
jgi:hypothetical protein